MIRLLGGGLIGFLLVALWIYCIFDVIATEDVLIRNLPKGLWLLIVIFIPDIGSIAWLALGRPPFAGWRPGDTGVRPPRRVLGPEDRPDFPSSRRSDSVDEDRQRLDAWEADLRRREQELKRRDGDEPPQLSD